MSLVSTFVRTKQGRWRLSCFEGDNPYAPSLALEIVGDKTEKAPIPLVRIQSECFTGHVFATLSCDCRSQLEASMDEIARAGSGAVIYLRQEGRGIGIVAKLAAYNLQAQGADTVDANLELGFGADDREYIEAAKILAELKMVRLRLLTNNPSKATDLRRHGIEVVEEVELPTFSREENSRYLNTKKERMGHRLTLD